jgi:hypothetical protein
VHQQDKINDFYLIKYLLMRVLSMNHVYSRAESGHDLIEATVFKFVQRGRRKTKKSIHPHPFSHHIRVIIISKAK